MHFLADSSHRPRGHLRVLLLLLSEKGIIYEFLGYHINVS